MIQKKISVFYCARRLQTFQSTMDKFKSALKSGKLRKQESSVHIADSSTHRSSVKSSVSFPTLFTDKPIALNRFYDVKDKMQAKVPPKSRPTVVFLQGSSKKKNLAYYDKQIYESLKQRKQVQVRISFHLLRNLEIDRRVFPLPTQPTLCLPT